MRTLAEIRAKFDRELSVRAAVPQQIDCAIAETGDWIFYLDLDSGEILTASLDAPRGDFQSDDLIAALLELGQQTSSSVH